MEHIRSAIAKARKERHENQTEARQQGSFRATVTVDAAPAPWENLPRAELDYRKLEQDRIFPRSGGPMAGAFDVLRTRVLQQMSANGWHRLAIASPTPLCGKSTVSLNLAFSLARQPERRVILAELDLRRPSLGRILGLQQRASVAAVLSGQEDFAANACRFGSNLAVSWNSAVTQNPSELLQSSTVPTVLKRIEDEYRPDVMIFDQPPMMAGDDALAFTRHVDAVILVAAAEETSIRQIDTCERELAQQTNVLGVVMNKCRYMEEHNDFAYGSYD